MKRGSVLQIAATTTTVPTRTATVTTATMFCEFMA